jgi:hypothetical protein
MLPPERRRAILGARPYGSRGDQLVLYANFLQADKI